MPSAYRTEFDIAVKAMQLAAEMQYEEGASQRLAGGVALFVVSLFGAVVIAPALRRGLPAPVPA